MDNEEEALLCLAATSVQTALFNVPIPRRPSLFDQRLQWADFCARYGTRRDFQRHIRMSPASFKKLLSFIRDDLMVDQEMANIRGGAILPEIALYATLRYLAGGSYSDIRFFTGISTSSFYRVVWKTVKDASIYKSNFLNQLKKYNLQLRASPLSASKAVFGTVFR